MDGWVGGWVDGWVGGWVDDRTNLGKVGNMGKPALQPYQFLKSYIGKVTHDLPSKTSNKELIPGDLL